MYSFKNDYSEGAHPDILKALLQDNNRQEEGYGLDSHCINAAQLIKDRVQDPGADVHFISGGTQTNLIAIGGALRSHEACITAKTGHIATHETGAIEATGHKLLTVDTKDGKLTPQLIGPVLSEHHFEHMVKPRLVYISQPTELGTVYQKDELLALSVYCREKNLLLYVDGARLGTAMTCKSSDLSMKELYELTDVFFIGGTKNGALLGEALVVRNNFIKDDLRYLIKQRGALLAKGRILGIQFEELFKENLFFDLARHAVELAQYMADELAAAGCAFLIDSPTNQIFPVMENEVIDKMTESFDFYTWEKVNETHSAVRLVTSWATPREEVQRFVDTYLRVVT